jgi:hypothetical protein
MATMPIDFDAVERQLGSNDPVSVLLRGHLWVETALKDLIMAGLEYPEHWKELERLSFPSKVALARAQGELPWHGALLELNRIRNKVGHDARFEVDDSIARGLATSFEPDFGHLGVGEQPLASVPNLKGSERPAEVIRESVLAILHYLLILAIDVLNVRTERMKEQTRRVKVLLPGKAMETIAGI